MARRKPMQVSIENVLEAHGELERFRDAFERDGDFHLRLHQDGLEDLTIEKVHRTQVAIAHTFVQNGDLMLDPEIVFHYDPDLPHSINWVPIEITQHPVGAYRSKFVKRNGQTMIDRAFDRDVGELVRVWAKNLRWQSWDQAEVVRRC